MKTGNRNIIVGILMGAMGAFILYIIVKSLVTQSEKFFGGMIVMVIIALLFMAGAVLMIRDGMRRRQRFSDIKENGTKHIGRIFSKTVDNVKSEVTLTVRYFDEDGNVRQTKVVTEYTRKKDLAPETDIAFLKHNEKTALLEKLGKHFSEEEHLRLKYPRPVSQYSVKDITDIIAPGDDLVEYFMADLTSNPMKFFDESHYELEERSVQREDEDSVIWLGMVEVLLEQGYACELDYKESLDEFVASVKSLKGAERLGLSMDEAWFDPEKDVPDWCKTLDDQWKGNGCCMGFIDIDSDSYVIFPCTLSELDDLQEIASDIDHWITYVADQAFYDQYEHKEPKKPTLAEDIPRSAAWAKLNLNQNGYAVDYDVESMKEAERFFAEQTEEGGMLIPGQSGSILFSIGCLIGETIIMNRGGEWITDDDDPQGEINIAVRLPDGGLIWPVQRCMKRMTNGPEDNIYSYVSIFAEQDDAAYYIPEVPQSPYFYKWDDEDIAIPEEFILTDDSYLHEALEVFFKAGGREFFKVEDADKYAYNWIDFVGNLYQEIEDGKYKPDGKYHKNPLSDMEREQLKKQGVPDLFLDDIKGDVQ